MRKEKRISSTNRRYLLIFIAIATIVTSGVAYRTLIPPPSEQYFAMWVLGSKGLAENYYPRDNPNLKIGEDVNWTLGIHNYMGSLQYVIVRVKLLNSTIAGPDELTGKPSSLTPLIEFTRVLVDNETWSMPFRWRILNATERSGNILLNELSINEKPINGELATASSGFNYRFVFELWFYDPVTNNLIFSWRTNDSQRSIWTQIWFNATKSMPT